MSKFFSAGSAILPVTGVDFSAAVGKLVKFVAGVPAVNDSATAPAIAVVLEGNTADKQSSLGLLGGLENPVRVQIAGDSADLKLGDLLQQKNDGTFTKDAGAGNARSICGVVSELNGAKAGDFAAAQLFRPIVVPAGLVVAAPAALTSAQNATAAAVDLPTAEALANALQTSYNALQVDVAALRVAVVALRTALVTEGAVA